MSTYPRESHERHSLASLTRQHTHIVDADGYPLCCNEPQPAPLRSGDDCPLCADIRKCLPDTVVVLHDVEVLPFSEPLVCKRCGGDLEIFQETEHRRGKVVVAVTSEKILCPRCGGMPR